MLGRTTDDLKPSVQAGLDRQGGGAGDVPSAGLGAVLMREGTQTEVPGAHLGSAPASLGTGAYQDLQHLQQAQTTCSLPPCHKELGQLALRMQSLLQQSGTQERCSVAAAAAEP